MFAWPALSRLGEGNPENVTDLAADWDQLADLDPLWAVLSWPGKKHRRWSVPQFLATGKYEIEGALAEALRRGYPTRWDAALDFGCGAGRLTAALAAHFQHVVGVDVSCNMIALARTLHHTLDTVEFTLNTRDDLAAFPDDTFDFVYSSRVLQHLTTRRWAIQYIREFLRVVRPGGLVCFQMPPSTNVVRLLLSRRRAWRLLRTVGVAPSYLYTTLGLHPMRLIALPQATVLREVQRSGGTPLCVLPDPSSPALYTQRNVYYVTKMGA